MASAVRARGERSKRAAPRFRAYRGRTALALFAAMLSACGGGGGGTPPVLESPAQPAPQPEPETRTRPAPTPQPEPGTQPETRTRPAPRPEPESPAQPAPQPTPEPETGTEPETTPEPETRTEPQPTPEPERRTEAEPETQPEPEPQTPPAQAAGAAVRAATTAYTHTPAADHPRRVVTTYRAETLEPATSPRTAGSWETAEYNAQAGLGRIRASTGYAARTTGKPGGGGVTIAVVEAIRVVADDAESPGHPDLRDVTVVNVSGRGATGAHATRVAGVAAARRNGYGMHGVAYNANIVTIAYTDDEEDDMEAILASVAGLTGRYGPDDSNKWDSVPAASAHVANFSFNLASSRNNPTPTLNGMKHMADQGRVMVAALGNSGGSEPAAIPASAVANDGIAGHAIAVGMLQATEDKARSTSNRCGAVKRWCVFAPGSSIYTTDGTYFSTGRGFHTISGTSFAAPHVAGAVAAVWAAFPNKTGRQIVQRILDTARQVDAANGNYDSDGLSPIYGHGALDLGAAMNPVGFTSLLTRGSGAVPVRRSFVALPPVFRPRPAAGLRDAVVYDTQMFPFLHDLNGAIRARRARSAATAVEDFLSPPRFLRSSQRLGRGVRVEFAWPRPDHAARDPAPSGELRDYRFRVAAAPSLSLRLGRSSGAGGLSDDFVSRRLDRGPYGSGFAAAPFAELAGDGTAFGVDWRRDDRTRLAFEGKSGSGYFGGGRARLASLGVTRRLGAGLTVRGRWGALRERGSVLGISGSGAFGGAPGARTHFLELGAERRTASGAAYFGSVGLGATKSAPPASGSLVSGWSGGRGESLALGGAWSGLWRDGDRLTVSASSPFRPRGAGLYVDVPDRELADGVVSYTRHRVDLSPRGREVRLQLAYEAETGPGAAVALGGFLRLNPDHDPEAAPEFGAAVKLRMEF